MRLLEITRYRVGSYVPISLNENPSKRCPKTVFSTLIWNLKSIAESYQYVYYVYVLNYSLKSDLAETLNVQISCCMAMDLWNLQILDSLRRFACTLQKLHNFFVLFIHHHFSLKQYCFINSLSDYQIQCD